MGKQMAVDKDALTPIANQFRNVLEIPSEYQFPLSEFPNMIESALGKTAGENYQLGYEDGKSQGSDEAYWRGYSDGTNNGIEIGKEQGYGEGTENGIESGKQISYDEFWDTYQQNGNRKSYEYAFYQNSWTDTIFKPKYDIVVIGSAYMAFAYTGIHNASCTIDLTQATSTSYLFYSSSIETVEKIIVSENTPFVEPFGYAYFLKRVIVEGVIGQSGFNAQHCSLDYDSIVSIINALATTTSGLSVTLKKAAVNKAFETSEGANDGSTSAEWTTLVGTRSNWTISLV